MHQLYKNTVFLIVVMVPSNAIFNKYVTIVPSCVVIMSAYGDLDKQKSATFIFQLFYTLVTNTFNDFKSR